MKRAGDIFTAIFDEKMMEKAEGYSAFFSCWKDLTEKNGIGSAFAHSWIKSMDKGLVWIEVDHPGWKQILQTKESKLLHDFRYRFPGLGISGISIMLCKPGARQEEKPLADNNPLAEMKPLAEKKPQEKTVSPNSQIYDYDTIKNTTLKETLMMLEKSIAERESQITANEL